MSSIATQYSSRHLKKIREKCRRSLYYFSRTVYGLKDMDPAVHMPLCRFLQDDPHPRKLICGFRGSFKSSVLLAYAAWKGLHCWDEEDGSDWSCLWIEQKWDNAVDHHRLFQLKFKVGEQADLLRGMYEDRIPARFAGWTDTQTVLERRDPTAEPFLTIGSLDSRLEGKHRTEILCDDLEGADAEKSDAPNAESWRFVEERAPDLLDRPATGKIIVSGTPHGSDPLVWKIREADAGGTLDNENRKFWHLWWRPILDESGQTVWPAQRPQEWCDRERERGQFSARAQKRWDMQLMLRRASTGGQEFDIDTLRKIAWRAELAPGQAGRARVVWKYPTIKYETGQNGIITAKSVPAWIDPLSCRFYIHWDPAHKDPSERIADGPSSDHALVVVGVTPDFHAIVAESWKGDVKIDVALRQFFRLYRKYLPYRWTYDPVGAQSYIVSHVKTLQETRYRGMLSLPTPWRPDPVRCPLPAGRGEPAYKVNREKYEEILNQLQLPVNERRLHLNTRDELLFHEFEAFGEAQESFDGLDALAQGPPFWAPPASQAAIDDARKRLMFRQLEEQGKAIYETPWSEMPLAG